MRTTNRIAARILWRASAQTINVLRITRCYLRWHFIESNFIKLYQSGDASFNFAVLCAFRALSDSHLDTSKYICFIRLLHRAPIDSFRAAARIALQFPTFAIGVRRNSCCISHCG